MKCSYCSTEIEKGTGFAYVRKGGTIRYYCSQRCYKFNVLHNRKINPKEVKKGNN
jgi:ribosomal protein L24E